MADQSDEPPFLRLATSNDSPELARQRATREICWPLSELTANLLRIVRGAGRPWEVYKQCYALIEAMDRFHAVHGRIPTEEVRDVLLISRPVPLGRDGDYNEREQAFSRMFRGSLQIAASTLVRQATQRRAGVTGLLEGVSDIERQRDERWIRRDQQASEARRKKRAATMEREKELGKTPRAKRADDELDNRAV